MRWLATFVTAVLMAQSQSNSTSSAKIDSTVSVQEKSQDFARELLDQMAAEFREMEAIVPHPSPFISAVQFFKTPTAYGIGVCSVDVVTVSVDEDPTAQRNGQRLKARSVHTERRYKLVGRGAPRDAHSQFEVDATNDLCRHLPTAKDFFVAEGEFAMDGAEGFRNAVVQAQSAGPLPFELACDTATQAQCRRTLSGMDPGRIGSVRPCPSPSPGQLLCHTIVYPFVEMSNGQTGWSIDVIAQLGSGPKTVRLRQSNYPVS